MTLLKQTLNEIYAPIDKELGEFSEALKNELRSSDPLIRDIHAHLLKMTGKFLRPALTLLCSKLGNKNIPDTVKLAVVIELIHTATLVHDDIIDNSELRRNQPSIYSKWGREISIVSGDYLYAKAFLLLAGFRDVWINQAFATCAHVMCEGEMKQIEKRTDFLMSEADYFKIIHKKTAALFQAACMGGAYLAGIDKDNIERLGNYGLGIGMAFQIVDDCLDLIGETQSLGKKTGLDVLKNDVTLPMLYLFQKLSQKDKKTLLNRIQNDGVGLLNEIQSLALETKSIETAMRKAREFSEKSIANLNGLKDSAYKESLSNLAHHCLERAR